MKRIRRMIVGIVVLLVVVVVAAVVWIDHVAKAGVERGATYALGVNTTLDRMDVGLVSGSVAMADLNVANPQGFTSPHFLHLGSGYVQVSLGSLMEDVVVLPELVLSGVSMNLERRGNASNYKVILDGMKTSQAQPQAGGKADQGEGSGKTFVVKRLVIDGVEANVDLLPLVGQLTRLPIKISQRIELTDIGTGASGEVKGVQMAELTAIVVEALLTAVVQQAGGVLPLDIAKDLTAELEGLNGLANTTLAVGGLVVSGVTQTAKQLEGEARRLGDEASEAGKELGEAGKRLGESLDGFLGKKKDEAK